MEKHGKYAVSLNYFFSVFLIWCSVQFAKGGLYQPTWNTKKLPIYDHPVPVPLIISYPKPVYVPVKVTKPVPVPVLVKEPIPVPVKVPVQVPVQVPVKVPVQVPV